jgi:hypothetical protein
LGLSIAVFQKGLRGGPIFKTISQRPPCQTRQIRSQLLVAHRFGAGFLNITSPARYLHNSTYCFSGLQTDMKRNRPDYFAQPTVFDIRFGAANRIMPQ